MDFYFYAANSYSDFYWFQVTSGKLADSYGEAMGFSA